MSEPSSPKKQPQQAGAAGDELGGLKPGDYLVHVFIEETRGLKNPKHADSTVDPIIEVKAFGINHYTKVQKDIGSGATFWGEHFFFEKHFSSAMELESEKIIINVQDHTFFGVNGRLGTVELSLPTVYYKDNHVMEYQWAALSGLTEKFQEVLGFIKFSVGVFGQDDKQVHLTEEKQLEKTTEGTPANVLYPPQITTESYQANIKVFRAERLKKMDSILGKTDPFMTVAYGGLEVQTSILKVTLDPVWNENLHLPATLPTVNERVLLKLWDWDAPPQPNELMGSAHFNISDIKSNKYKSPFWINIYGAQEKAKKEFLTMQNEIPELATEWKGRVQVAFTLRDEPKPKLGRFPLKEPTTQKLADDIKRERFVIRAQIHYAMNLRKDDENYTVRIRWGPDEVSTKKLKSKNRMIEIYESIYLKCEFPYSTSMEMELPDVFIYLNNGDKDISLYRKPWTDFIDPAVKNRPFYFKVNKAVTTTREDLAGIVKMRLYAHREDDSSKLSANGWDKPIQKIQPHTAWKTYLNIYQGRDLIAADNTGVSDPYLKAYLFGRELKTSVIEKTLNPIWNERLEFETYFDDLSEAPPLILTLWDEDIGSQDDFMGSAILNIDQSNLNPETMPNPKWVDIKYGKDNGTFGKILLSVCCYNKAELIPRSPYIEPDSRKFHVNMKILGLRQLESNGLLPVKRAYVKFDIDSLRNKGEKAYMAEKKFIKTEPLNPGPNPNILTVINFDADLPSNPEFCPSLSCAVYDNVFKGISQPLLGNFSIPLGDIMKQTSVEVEKRVEILTKLFYANQKIQEEKAAIEAERKKIFRNTVDKIQKMNDAVIEMSKNKKVEETKENSATDVTLNTQASLRTEPLLKEDDEVKAPAVKKGKADKDDIDILDDMNEEVKASQNFVIVPKYDTEGREEGKPNTTDYLELGHTNKQKTSTKHYRLAVDSELEKTNYIDASAFMEIPLYRGKRITETSLFSNIFKKNQPDYKCVGYFKAMINVMSEFDQIRYEAKLKHVGKLAHTKGLEFSDDEFLRRRDVIVRLYMIQANDLPWKDDNSPSDPYLVIKFGKTVYNESKHYQEDNCDPTFHKCYEFGASLPGASKLNIELWDYDPLDPDDLIGSTTIDIEDRWYSSKWRGLKHVPIETRTLYHPSSKVSQGTVKLWLEIIPKDAPKPPLWNIQPKPDMDCELRVVVWECKDVPNVDIEDATDIYITGKLTDGQTQRTDTHFRSQNGFGSFNWRMVFPIKLPMKKHRISLAIWDKDLLSANDYISEATYEFEAEAARCFDNEEETRVLGGPGKKDVKFWIPCSNTKMINGRPTQETMGSILVSMSIVPKAQATLNPVGKGRSNPNQNPYLPAPEGRFQWSLNPIKLFNQTFGPAARRKICGWCCCLIFIILFIMILPSLIANLITRVA